MDPVSEPAERIALPPYYYRENFLCLCDTVESQYLDLLKEAETRFLSVFRSLSFDAQCLYVRLISRVGPWFRASRLDYQELRKCAELLPELQSAGLLEVATELAPAELGTLYTREELTAVLGSHIDDSTVRDKGSLLDAIADSPLDDHEATSLLRDFDGHGIVAPGSRETVQVLQLLFFGNRRQSLTDFVLSDLGVARYYPYALDRRHRKFESRDALEEYMACLCLSDRWYELRDEPEPAALVTLGQELTQLGIKYDSSRGRWARLCNGVARDLERLGDASSALALYSQSQRHPGRERIARILERDGELESARNLCEQIIEQPWCEDERDAAARILPRLLRLIEGKSQHRSRDRFKVEELRLKRGAKGVERSVAEALSERWDTVEYVENRLMNTLFGLAFWDQIFTPVPGVFHNPFQSVPADMYDPDFRSRRSEALDRRMEQLAAADLREELGKAFDSYMGYQCRWVDWRYVDSSLVSRTLATVPREHLLRIWDRMLFDPGENRRGFPDLIALGAMKGDYCLIEVKGPGDNLQHSQRRWLRFFGENMIPACIARVEWLDD